MSLTTLQNNLRSFNLIENYIYFYHIKDNSGNGTFMVLPTYPERITDSLSATFATSSPIARTAPIFSYSYSGPRTLQVNFSLHRDMMQQINRNVSNIIPGKEPWGDSEKEFDDYVDTLINYLQAIAVPKYSTSNKKVDPPMIAIRFGEDIFIKGVVQGGVSVVHQLPLLDNGKYAMVDVSFQVSEVDPYDAESIINKGSLRGLSTTLERSFFRS